MSDSHPLKVVLCWHMHQPQYRDFISRQYALPWTYLHAIKDYTDMAAHLEAVPEARAVVNFAPVLLEQLADYVGQIDGYLTDGRAIRDPLLAAMAMPVLPSRIEERELLLHCCLRANEQRMIQRYPAYTRLASIARDSLGKRELISYLGDSFFSDLLVWYHLAWMGETVRRSDVRLQRLINKAVHFSLHERREVLAIIGELLKDIVPRYRRLAEAGQIELSVTPYAHPIVPLMLDMNAAHESLPEAPLPVDPVYPGGADRARWHVHEGIAQFEKHFGCRPSGCWPSEGGVSDATLNLLAENGIAWTATGETVLSNSLHRLGHAPHAMKAAWLYSPYRIEGRSPACFFRDDGLSDLIGFTYSTWHGDDAVADFVNHLERIADSCEHHPDRIVTVILDGENAWESYPENGYYFLSALYQKLSSHPRLEMTTFSRFLSDHSPKPIRGIVAGSWVYGTFSTWIGDPDKNRGWEMLVDAKKAFDRSIHGLSADERAAAERALAICEGSDWFWWFGDYNPAQSVSDFDNLYRRHLTNLYQYLHLEPPEYLTRAFSHGGGDPEQGGTMRHGKPS